MRHADHSKIADLTYQLIDLNTSQKLGFIKPYKAHNIADTVLTVLVRDLSTTRASTKSFLQSCMEMEGFTDAGIEAATAICWECICAESEMLVQDEP